MAHPVVHIELSANSLEEAQNFYSRVFGWEMQAWPEVNYATWSSGEGAPGGGFNVVSEQVPAGSTVVYIETDNLEESMTKIEQHGGQRTSGNMDVPDVGTIAWFRDPAGNMMALLQRPGAM